MAQDGVPIHELLLEDGPEDHVIRNDGIVMELAPREARLPLEKRPGLEEVTQAQIRAEMAALYKEGESHAEIAERLNEKYGLQGPYRMTSGTISKNISALKSYWRAVGALHIDEKQALLLSRLDYLEAICINAYFASCEGKRTSYYERQLDRAKSKERQKNIKEDLEAEREGRVSKRAKDNPVQKAKELMFSDLGNDEENVTVLAEKIKKFERTETSMAGDPRWMAQILNITEQRAKLLQMYNRKAPDDEDVKRAKLSDEERRQRFAAVINQVAIRKQIESGATNLAPAASLGGTRADQPTVKELAPLPEEVLGEEATFEFDFSEVDRAEIKPKSSFGEDFWD